MNKMVKEVWVDIKGYKDLYQISTLGNVNSIRSGKILKTNNNGTGYLQVHLCVNKERVARTIHRLVLEHFDRVAKPGEQGMHKNNNKQDNRLCNLEWGTPSRNMSDAYKTGIRKSPRGHLSCRAKLNKAQVKMLRKLYSTGNYTILALARGYNISYTTANYIINKRTYYDNKF